MNPANPSRDIDQQLDASKVRQSTLQHHTQASVDGTRPIAIDALQSVLCHDTAVLDYLGFTVRDTTSGKLAEHRVIDELYSLSDSLIAGSGFVVEILYRERLAPYIVQQTFQTPTPEQRASQLTLCPDDLERKALAEDLELIISDQTVCLEAWEGM